MKDLGEASYILGIQVIRDRKNRTIALSQASYIDKILSRFSMQDSKKGMLPFRHGIKLSKEQVPKNEHEKQFMSRVPYTSAVGSLIKPTSGSVFTIEGGAVIWRSIKQSCITNSTMEAEYVATCEAAKEAVWLRQFLANLEMVPDVNKHITIYYDNSGAMANSRKPKSHKKGENLTDPFTKALPQKSFDGHLENMGMRDMTNLL
ncbi:hypothetical protein LWI28_008892 [Acer negundo]|uniref:Gag/pol protein n=1 Tax=Acer negundo TaxID=4023 RepID=A0AAD5IR85_ACENE|nr:hypothetical protein LWI28_008892 [Acer negundo]